MKRSVFLLVASLALLVSLAAALAAADSETPNDPRVNPNANACYTGGSMEGKCNLDGDSDSLNNMRVPKHPIQERACL